MTEAVWLTVEIVKALHDQSLEMYGGLPGIRDAGQLESAVARPLNLIAYGEPSIFELAASYAYGIARTHPFSDGNKRAALMAADVFLKLNGWDLWAPPADATVTFLALAAGTLSESELAAWLEHGCVRLT